MYLPLDMTSLRSFADELLKIASMDAGTRAALAGKLGKARDYFPGGELPSNAPGQTNFEPKLASMAEKFVELRDKAEEPTVTALKGAGGGILAGQLLTGGRLGNHSGLARLGYRGAGAIGAGLALADHYVSDHVRRRASMPKTANVNSATFTPARQLSAGVQTDSFEHKIHNEGAKLHPPKVGQKFNFPSTPQ